MLFFVEVQRIMEITHVHQVNEVWTELDSSLNEIQGHVNSTVVDEPYYDLVIHAEPSWVDLP